MYFLQTCFLSCKGIDFEVLVAVLYGKKEFNVQNLISNMELTNWNSGKEDGK